MSKKIKIAFIIAIAINVVMAVVNLCLGNWIYFWLNASTAIFAWLIYKLTTLNNKLIEENRELISEVAHWKYRHSHPEYDKILTDIENNTTFVDYYNSIVAPKGFFVDDAAWDWGKSDIEFKYETPQEHLSNDAP